MNDQIIMPFGVNSADAINSQFTRMQKTTLKDAINIKDKNARVK